MVHSFQVILNAVIDYKILSSRQMRKFSLDIASHFWKINILNDCFRLSINRGVNHCRYLPERYAFKLNAQVHWFELRNFTD